MMNLSHAEALTAIDASRDKQLEPALQQALDDHLAECAECRGYQAEFSGLEKRLAVSLQARWPINQPDQHQMAAVFENIQAHSRQNTMKNFFSNTARLIAWGTLAVLVIALLAWGIQNLRPVPAVPAVEDIRLPINIEPTIQVTDQPPLPTEAVIEQPTQIPSDMPILSPGSANSMPGIQFNFAVDFPQSSEQLTLYRIQLSAPVNADSARQTAVQWGIHAPIVYDLGPGEADNQVLLDATDGIALMRFINFAEQFLYWPNYASVLDDNGPILPFDQQVTIATQYLQDQGVLHEPFRVVPIAEERSKVRFIQFLDDIPVIYSIGTNRGSTEWIDVAVDAAGQIAEVDVAQHDYQPIGNYPILTAQQAWERFISEKVLQHANFAILGPEKPVTYQSWTRNPAYQPGQPVDIYGYVSIMQPVDPANPAWISINNLEIDADPVRFSTANPWDFIHLWGQIAQQENGSLAVDMQDWEVSLLSDDILTGTIQRQGDLGLFSTQTGEYILPDLPGNFPDGALANVRGIITQGTPPTFEWSNIDTGEIPFYYGSILSCGGGGGGGGGEPVDANFGDGSMRGLNLSGEPVPQTDSTSSPYSPGYLIEAITGTPYFTIYQYPNGLQIEEINFLPEPGSDLSNEVNYRLEGVILGNQQTHNLPVHIWGQVDRYDPETSTVVVHVDQFEPVYPGLQIQQWAGTEQIANIEGRDVVLFTTSGGQTYVTGPSLEWPADSQLIGTPGDLIGIEGYILPGQLYGGYAIIKEMAGELPPNDIIESAVPTIIDPSMMDGNDQEQYLVGQVTVEKIELAYRSISMQRCTSDFSNYPDADQYLTLQPIWVYTGHFTDGRQFQLHVQALPDEFLY